MASPSVLLVLASAGWGGTEKAFVDLVNGLAPRCPTAVLIPSDAVYRERLAGSVRSVHLLRPGSRRNPLVIRHLRGVVREVRPDIVHTHAARATEMVYWLGKLEPVRHVATKHNTRPRRVFSRVPHVTAVSEAAKSSIDRPERVTVVYNGVDLVAPPRVPKPDVFTVLGVGRLHRHKGFDALVTAVHDLAAPCVLELAGDGPERTRLEELARSLGARDRVSFLGHREDVTSLMARAHVQVVSSRTEGFSLALLEGLLCCDVVLSTRVGIAPEILPDDLLVDLDGLAPRLTDVRARHAEYAERTRRAREAVGDRFTLSAAVEAYLALYDRVVRGA